MKHTKNQTNDTTANQYDTTARPPHGIPSTARYGSHKYRRLVHAAQRLAHFLHTEGVIGSIPISPTVITARFCRAFFPFLFTLLRQISGQLQPRASGIGPSRFDPCC